MFKKNISILAIFILLTLGSNFLLYRVSHTYLLDDEKYGLWLVILSLVTWFYIMDLGISNSLRNQLTTAVEQNDIFQQKKLIVTTYIAMLVPLIGLLLLSIISNKILDWNEILNVHGTNTNANLPIKLSFLMFPFVFYLNTISYVYHSFFKSYLVSILQFLNLFINCIVLLLITPIAHHNLTLMAGVYFSINIIIYLYATLLFFMKNKDFLKLKYFDIKLIKPLLSIGISFFFLDITSIILYNSGPLLISFFFRPEDTISFQLPYKILSIFITLSQILLTPLWTLLLTKVASKKINEIKEIHSKMLKNFLLVLLGIILSSFFVNSAIEIWIGKNYDIDIKYILLISILIVLSIFCRMYQTLLNSLTIISAQVFVFILAVCISLISMYTLIEVLDYGQYAFISSLILGLIFPALCLPYIYKKSINKINFMEKKNENISS